ncbi:tRNA (adenosine(37)-N6)-threonylcarbamoyltransferase complex ATPase subunit type 1 TsaE [Cellulosimicrobium arenosum]|uniref:tRNA threonylcarbamoyladenosine biosynthesis protein TsaE n=1 Tax=Cellulosimicrobium arenosum TaxID=2708133 RepID=A0A927J215_9MICO|nr:tRNA (adenosine(37)-N6)-threonylcarbamoyltransferase complex ATPase subunit type 1 TsaE [Cellulosimicrobium arenosum]
MGAPEPGTVGPDGPDLVLVLPDADATRAFGRALAARLRAGDLVILTGDLGAGKTTLTQGVGAGLGVRGQVASPTFIVAREHPSLVGGPALVHVDAYRLGSLDEVDALDLDSSLDDSVTIVEWGQGLVEALAGDRLEVVLERPRGAGGVPTDGADDPHGGRASEEEAPEAGERRVVLRGVGQRWADLDVATLARDAGTAPAARPAQQS